MTDRSIDVVHRAGVLGIRRETSEWLSGGWNGGFRESDWAYVITVPPGWERTDLDDYGTERLHRAGFDESGPMLFTRVAVANARCGRCGPVTVLATAGISNPVALPMDPSGGTLPPQQSTDSPDVGTINLVVTTDRTLAPGALVTLHAVAAEAKTATLLAETAVTGTTTDAIVVGHVPAQPDHDNVQSDHDSVEFAGSGTRLGAATRAGVRDALRAALSAHYDDPSRDNPMPTAVEESTYGSSTDVRASVFAPRNGDETSD